MLSFPNAKINLGLQVLRKRSDGYHDIETVFYPVSMSDSLEILPASGGKTRMHLYGIALPQGENICTMAYHLLKNEFDIPMVDIHLLKNIPSGAGLGGGSSDAAHTLLMLNEMFSLGISPAKLKNYAVKIGSDCPFFIHNKPAFASGRGEVLEDIDLDLSAYRIELEYPGTHISTPEAYAMLKPDNKRPSLREIIREPVTDWKHSLINDFEGPVFEHYPAIKRLKEEMYQRGAVYASMSGSGSAVYGLFVD